MVTFVGRWSRSKESWKRMRPKAKRMRREPTPAEAALWQSVRHGRLGGLKFRRQHPVGHYFADLCCPMSRLIVEADGPIYDEREKEDAARQAFLEGRGYRVLRFRSEEILNSMESVLERVLLAAMKE